MATKRQRGATWHYVIRRKGTLPRPVYLSFTDETEGDRYVARLEALLDKGIVPDELKRPAHAVKTLRDLVRTYLSTYAVSPADRAILEMLDGTLRERADSIDFRWAEAQVAAMKDQLLAPGTIRHRIGALARCLDWAARSGEIPANPLRLLPHGYAVYVDGAVEDQSRERRLEPEEETRIRQVLAGGYVPAHRQRPLELEQREALVLLFDLALETAMRLRETFTLEWRQIDLAKRTIFLDKTKNGDRRQVPLSTVALAALNAQEGDRSGLLLPFYDGHMARTTSRLSRLWGRVFDHAGCPDLHFHDLRREATSRLFERTTLSVIEISLITGHRDLKMLRRYSAMRASDLASQMW